MKHDHPQPVRNCAADLHSLKLCTTCDVVHCEKCTKEWNAVSPFKFTTTSPEWRKSAFPKGWQGGNHQPVQLYGSQPEPIPMGITNQPGFPPTVLCEHDRKY